jgi:hypothetical protein
MERIVEQEKEPGLEWRPTPTREIGSALESFAMEMEAAGLEVVHREVRWIEIWRAPRPEGEIA